LDIAHVKDHINVNAKQYRVMVLLWSNERASDNKHFRFFLAIPNKIDQDINRNIVQCNPSSGLLQKMFNFKLKKNLFCLVAFARLFP